MKTLARPLSPSLAAASGAARIPPEPSRGLSRELAVAALTLLVACTPLGLWVYEAPTVGLDDVRSDSGTAKGAELRHVLLTLRNGNDYELSLRSVELVLRADGRDVGSITLDTVLTLAPKATQALRLEFLPRDPVAHSSLAEAQAGGRSYAVVGRARVGTPIGDRDIGFSRAIPDGIER